MSFQISDKVVCVDDCPGPGTIRGEFEFPNGFVKRGDVYTVERVAEQTFREGELIVVFIAGKPAFSKKMGQYYGWEIYRFRRLQELKDEAKAKKVQRQPIHTLHD